VEDFQLKGAISAALASRLRVVMLATAPHGRGARFAESGPGHCAEQALRPCNCEKVMENKPEANVGKFVSRHLSQIKLLSRVLEHELDVAKGAREVTIDRHMIENVLDTLEIFVEDCEGAAGVQRDRSKGVPENKPAVARLN
jgi:hypothetical protein